jgi:hypothetical protein
MKCCVCKLVIYESHYERVQKEQKLRCEMALVIPHCGGFVFTIELRNKKKSGRSIKPVSITLERACKYGAREQK